MFSWFATKNGRIFTNISIGIVAASTLSFPLIIHGPLIDRYQTVLTYHEKNKPKPLSPEMENRATKVLEACDLKATQKEKFRFFYTFGLDVIHIGGKESPWGASVGIPFTFEEKHRHSYNNIRFAGFDDSEDWIYDYPELIDTFTLPENAQNYALAREIYSARLYNLLENAVISTFSLLLFPAYTAKRINAVYNTFNYPLRTRMWIYVVLYSLGLVAYKCLRNPTRHLLDKRCDQNVAKLGPDYIDGGIALYENTLTQNQLLRQVFKKKGESMFTKDGEENYWLFPPKLPLLTRIENLKKLKNEIASG